MYFLSKTKEGKWAIIFIIFFFLCFSVMQIMIALGQTGGEKLPGNLLLFIPGILAGFFGVNAFIVGAFSILRRKERGILVLLITLFGCLITLFIFGEFLFPH